MKRETELDLLRLTALLMVMLLHVNSSVWAEISLFTPQWAAATALRQTWAVPVLVMITGRLLLDPDREPKLKKRLARLVSAFGCWSLVYQLYYLAADPSLDWKGVLAGLVTGAYHMWYLWMLLGLYAITPLLRSIARDRGLCRLFLGLHLLAGIMTYLVPELPMVGNTLGKVAEMVLPGFLLGYPGLYLLGWYLHKWPPRKGTAYGAGLGCAVISLLGNLLIAHETGINSEFFTNYLSPTMLPIAGAVFLLFTSQRPFGKPEFWRRVSRLSLHAYLSHALVNEGVVRLFGKGRLMANPLWMLPATALVAAGSFGIAYLIERGRKLWTSTL